MIRRVFSLTFLAMLMSVLALAQEPPSIRQTVLDAIERHPGMDVQDLYKLAYQSALGNEHIMKDTAEARRYLRAEFDSVDANKYETLIEFLRDDGSVVRVNLRAYKGRKGSADALFTAMTQSAAAFRPSKDLLRTFWDQILVLSAGQKIPFEQAALRAYFAEQERKSFPPVDHSPFYVHENRPSYRVILRQFLPY